MKNTMWFLLGLICIIGFSSCQKEGKAVGAALEYANQRLHSINEKWQEQAIDLSAVLAQPQVALSDEDATIVTYYDADCSSCLSDLGKWKATLMPFFEAANPNVEFCFILKTTDLRTLEYNLQQIGIPKEYVIIDTKDLFLKTFDFADEKAFNTFLVNASNEVVFIGSPLVSENLRKHYAKQITS